MQLLLPRQHVMGCWEGWPDSQRRAPAAAAGSWESPPAHPLAETPPWRWCLMLTLQVLKDTSDAQRFAHSRFTTVGQGKALGCTSWHNVVRGPASSRKRDGESKAPPHFSSHVHAHSSLQDRRRGSWRRCEEPLSLLDQKTACHGAVARGADGGCVSVPVSTQIFAWGDGGAS